MTKAAMVIGCFGHLSAAELSVACTRKLHGDSVPILLSDDCTPDSEETLRIIANRYPNVHWRRNEKRWGLDGRDLSGDQTAFYHGLLWAKELGCDTLFKASQRFIVHGERHRGWLNVWSARLVASRHAVATRNCREGAQRFHCRSECVVMKVSEFTRPEVLDAMAPRQGHGGEPQMREVTCRFWSGSFMALGIVGVNRQSRVDGILWHCANKESEYNEVAESMGIKWRPSTIGPNWRTPGMAHAPSQLASGIID